MLAWRPDGEAGLVKANTQAWSHDLPQAPHRYKDSWLQDRYQWLDAEGKRLFQDGEKSQLKNAVDASVLQEIQLAMLTSGAENKVEEAKADLKS